MRLVRSLQHGLSGIGPRLHVADVVPDRPPIRPWAETFPWAALVAAIEPRLAPRFPQRSPRGRAPVPIRVVVALEWLHHAVGASDEAMCPRVRTDCAVMDACGLRAYQAPRAPAPVVLPETRSAFRGRIDEALRDARRALHAAAAMDEGLVSPAPRVVETFPAEHGRQRLTDATTRYQAPQKPLNSSMAAPRATAARPPS
jgi:hypothetical protein